MLEQESLDKKWAEETIARRKEEEELATLFSRDLQEKVSAVPCRAMLPLLLSF
jgi:hypothetical protein